MKIKKVLRVLLMIAPVLMVLAVYGKLPDVVPVHWGINGEVDRYGSKMELFIIAGMNIFLGIFMPFFSQSSEITADIFAIASV